LIISFLPYLYGFCEGIGFKTEDYQVLINFGKSIQENLCIEKPGK